MVMQVRVFLSVAFGLTALVCQLWAWALAWQRDWSGAAGLWGYGLLATTLCIIVVGIPREDE